MKRLLLLWICGLFITSRGEPISVDQDKYSTTLCKNSAPNKSEIQLQFEFELEDACETLSANFSVFNQDKTDDECQFYFTVNTSSKACSVFVDGKSHDCDLTSAASPVMLTWKSTYRDSNLKTDVLSPGNLEFVREPGRNPCWKGSAQDGLCYTLAYTTKSSQCGITIETGAEVYMLNTTTTQPTTSEELYKIWWFWVVIGVGVVILIVLVGVLIWWMLYWRKSDEDVKTAELIDDDVEACKSPGRADKSEVLRENDHAIDATQEDERANDGTQNEATDASGSSSSSDGQSKYIGALPPAVISVRAKRKK